jgi:predicted membrane GTPase involved in stress response
MLSMETKGERMIVKFIPSRGIIGLRNQLLPAGIMSHRYIGYEPLKDQLHVTKDH